MFLSFAGFPAGFSAFANAAHQDAQCYGKCSPSAGDTKAPRSSANGKVNLSLAFTFVPVCTQESWEHQVCIYIICIEHALAMGCKTCVYVQLAPKGGTVKATWQRIESISHRCRLLSAPASAHLGLEIKALERAAQIRRQRLA